MPPLPEGAIVPSHMTFYAKGTIGQKLDIKFRNKREEEHLFIALKGNFTNTFVIETRKFSVPPRNKWQVSVHFNTAYVKEDHYIDVYAIYDENAKSAEEAFADKESYGRAGIQKVPILISTEDKPSQEFPHNHGYTCCGSSCKCRFEDVDITTQPDTKIVFNAPYDDKQIHHVKATNSYSTRLGWKVRVNNMKRYRVEPTSGVLDPKETTLIAVSCEAFAYGQEDRNYDVVTIEWVIAPKDADKQFRSEWFEAYTIVHKKNLTVDYNP